MILKDPKTGKKITTRYDFQYRRQFLDSGWIDVTPEPTQAQLTQRNKWMAHGQLARTLANLKLCLLFPGGINVTNTTRDRISDLIETLEYELSRIRGGG